MTKIAAIPAIIFREEVEYVFFLSNCVADLKYQDVNKPQFKYSSYSTFPNMAANDSQPYV